jgi:serine/threonine protein kinase
MGEVFLATDPLLGRTVAIKMLMEDNEELRERFAREARSAAALNHQNIVTIYDVGEDAGRPFIAMEYLDGETMAELIHRRAPLTTRRKLELMLELCAGLGQAHRSGIVHRDVKPANLVITTDGALKILDFGIARVKEDATSGGLTLVGMLIGSPHYMSPEQADGQAVDDRSDIFAVGSVFYELLTGERAFPGDNPPVVLTRILTKAPRPVRELQPLLDAEIERILDKALAKDRAQRYQTLAELAADIGRVRDREPTHEVGQTVLLSRDSPSFVTPESPHTPTPAFRGALDSRDIPTVGGSADDALGARSATRPPPAIGEIVKPNGIEIREDGRLAETRTEPGRDSRPRGRSWLWASAAGLLTAVLIVAWFLQPPPPPPIDPDAAAREAISRAEGVYRAGARQDAIVILTSATPHALIEAKLSEWRAALSDPERDAIASAAVEGSRKLFLSRRYEEAIDRLVSFKPEHPTVTQALTQLRAELDQMAGAAVAEARKKSEAEAITFLDAFRPKHALVSKELAAVRSRVQQQEAGLALARARTQAESALKKGDLLGAVAFADEGFKAGPGDPTLTEVVHQAVAAAANRAAGARQRANDVSQRQEYASAVQQQQLAEKRRGTQPAEAIKGFAAAEQLFRDAIEAGARERDTEVARLRREIEAAIAVSRLDEAERLLGQLRSLAPTTSGLDALETRIRNGRRPAGGDSGNRGSGTSTPNSAEVLARQRIDELLGRYRTALEGLRADDLAELHESFRPQDLALKRLELRGYRKITWAPQGGGEFSLSADGQHATLLLPVVETYVPLRSSDADPKKVNYRFDFVLTASGWKISTAKRQQQQPTVDET